MNRRDFLKVGGVTALLLSVPVWKLTEHFFVFPVAEFKGRFFRGTPNGEIHISADQKQTWQKQAGFGPELAIRELFLQGNGRLTAKVEYRGWSFNLSLSEDEKDWLVV